MKFKIGDTFIWKSDYGRIIVGEIDVVEDGGYDCIRLYDSKYDVNGTSFILTIDCEKDMRKIAGKNIEQEFMLEEL